MELPILHLSDINNTTDGAIAVAVADVDRNGYNDILSASFDDDKIQWFENSFVQSGTTTFSISKQFQQLLMDLIQFLRRF